MSSTQHTYIVTGMTCEHCRLAVIEEISKVAGVQRVVVDLTTGRVEVFGDGIAATAVASAVVEAGYEVVP